MEDQIEALAADFTAVAWDAPGCGQSSDPPASFRMPDYADCLAELIAELGLGRPHVIGLSFGGTLALELFQRHPTLPRTLLLASAYAGWAGSLPPDAVAKRLREALRGLRLPPAEFAANWLPSLFTASAAAETIAEAKTIMSELRPAGARAMLHAMAEADLRDILPQIDVPTLLLYGEADERSPRRVAKELRDRIRGSELVLMSGVGHQSNMEAPDRFNAEVLAFLRAQGG